MAVDRAPAAAGRCGGLARHRWPRLLGALAVCLLALLTVACTSQGGRQGSGTSPRTAAGPTQRDYWPTAGWRTAAPADQGMDPAVLGDLDRQVPDQYPQVRSLLVVRHGYLVYERYWQGFDVADGQEIHSVTKSVISARSGSPWASTGCRAWTRPSGSCWPPTSPTTPTRGCARSPSGSC